MQSWFTNTLGERFEFIEIGMLIVLMLVRAALIALYHSFAREHIKEGSTKERKNEQDLAIRKSRAAATTVSTALEEIAASDQIQFIEPMT